MRSVQKSSRAKLVRAAVAAFHLPVGLYIKIVGYTRVGERWEEGREACKKIEKGRQLFPSFLKAASFDPCNYRYAVERLDPVCSTTFSYTFSSSL